MIAVVKDGAVERIVDSTTGLNMTGRTTQVLPEDYDPAAGNYAFVDGVFVPNISLARLKKKIDINAERDARQAAGCETPLGIMDTDDKSRLFLSGAVQMAMIAKASAQPFAIDWTMADNSVVEHSADEIIAAGVTVGQFIGFVHYQAVALKAAVDDATTVEAVAAVAWPD